MQCNYNSFIQMINFHGLFRNALRCQKIGACRILVPLWYLQLKKFDVNCCERVNFRPNLSENEIIIYNNVVGSS